MFRPFIMLCSFGLAFLYFEIVLVGCIDTSKSIKTIPNLPSNQIASGFTGLISTISFKKQNYTSCSWVVSESRQLNIFTEFASCSNQSVVDEEDLFNVYITCVNLTTEIDTSLTIIEVVDSVLPFGGNMIKFELTCDSKKVVEALSILVKDCNVTLPLLVDSASSKYNSNGVFRCNNSDSVLFYNNSTQLQSNRTVCLVTAEWSGAENLECWNEPQVMLIGANATKENETLYINCSYNDVFPIGNKSVFYFAGINFTLPKGDLYPINISRADDLQTLQCQAITPYTEIETSRGLSKEIKLNVFYPPYFNNSPSCKWILNLKNQNCNLSLFSNPPVKTYSIQRNGEAVNFSLTIDANNEKRQTVILIQSTTTITERDNGTYMLIVTTDTFYKKSLDFEIFVVNESLANTSQSNVIPQEIIIAIACVGSFLVIFAIMLVFYIYFKHKRKTGSNEQEMVTNELYGETINFDPEVKELKNNILYQPYGQTDEAIPAVTAIEPVYAETGALQDQTRTSNSENYNDQPNAQEQTLYPASIATYGVVDKSKKKLKQAGGDIKDLYGKVDLSKKTKKKGNNSPKDE